MADWMDEWLQTRREDCQRMNDGNARLRDLDLVVLDNSVRESTVGQLRGHTPEDKFKIFEEAERCGFKDKILGSINHLTRVDDQFIKDLTRHIMDNNDAKTAQDIRNGFWGFIDLPLPKPGEERKVLGKDAPIPGIFLKMKDLGCFNVIWEIDLGDTILNWEVFTVDDFCALMQKHFDWFLENLPWSEQELQDVSTMGEQSKVLKQLYGEKPPIRVCVNFRDLADAWKSEAGLKRVFKVADFLTKMPKHYNIWALLYEDSDGNGTPEENGNWTKALSEVIKHNKSDAHLLVHVHHRFGYAQSSVMKSLLNGANGLWAGVAEEGAFLGQAATCITIINLIRLGNKKVLERYNCKYLRTAAIHVTKITTGREPHSRQIVFGPRALDAVFTIDGLGFNLAEFFEERAPMRMSTMANAEMIQEKLRREFPDVDKFNQAEFTKCTQIMREKILIDLNAGYKCGYMSRAGMALLYKASGGTPTQSMLACIAQQEANSAHGELLIRQAREKWDLFDCRESEEKQCDGCLEFDSFYNGFMAPYFGCYHCTDTHEAFHTLDMDKNGMADWEEFKLFLIYALEEHPDRIVELEDLLNIAFLKGILPLMKGLPVNNKESSD